MRNNWITETQRKFCFSEGDHLLNGAHNPERNDMFRPSRLNEVSGFPSPIECQKVSTCLKVFADEAVADF